MLRGRSTFEAEVKARRMPIVNRLKLKRNLAMGGNNREQTWTILANLSKEVQIALVS
jgi:hypothetical protein